MILDSKLLWCVAGLIIAFDLDEFLAERSSGWMGDSVKFHNSSRVPPLNLLSEPLLINMFSNINL